MRASRPKVRPKTILLACLSSFDDGVGRTRDGRRRGRRKQGVGVGLVNGERDKRDERRGIRAWAVERVVRSCDRCRE